MWLLYKTPKIVKALISHAFEKNIKLYQGNLEINVYLYYRKTTKNAF